VPLDNEQRLSKFCISVKILLGYSLFRGWNKNFFKISKGFIWNWHPFIKK